MTTRLVSPLPRHETAAAISTASASAGLPSTRTESTIEWTYLAQLTAWTAVQVDLQYVIHPGTDPALGHAWVGFSGPNSPFE